MFDNLLTALQKKCVSLKQYARVLGIGETAVRHKLAGETDFIYDEVVKTRTLLPEYSADYLFAENAAKEAETVCVTQ